jgi:hypothetical protein
LGLVQERAGAPGAERRELLRPEPFDLRPRSTVEDRLEDRGVGEQPRQVLALVVVGEEREEGLGDRDAGCARRVPGEVAREPCETRGG